MYGWRNFVDKVKRYWPLERFEKRGLIITLLVLSLTFFLIYFGENEFDIGFGMQKLFLVLVFVTITYVVREFAHRTVAIWLGYKSQFKAWVLGLVVGLIIVFLFRGKIPFIAPGALVITHLPYHRLGKPYYELSMKHLGWIAMSAPIANMFFAIILKGIFVVTQSEAIYVAMMINIWLALFDMIPIPPFNGSRTFFGSRYIYIFVLGALLGCAALLISGMNSIIAIIGSLILGALVLLVFFVFVDKNW